MECTIGMENYAVVLILLCIMLFSRNRIKKNCTLFNV